ncbi:CGNR zinc finger domain-containing protein [Micromonospora sp. NPDC126480]|uniref:CGNR zinc finger domain-containing protein n=1 Tax=Micromonospora sp. NPDC126480 TaxID=3155312 RepID=UPI00333348D0
MILRHEAATALVATAALVNTNDGRNDLVSDVAALNDLARSLPLSPRQECDASDLREVRDLRPRLRQLWFAREKQVIDIVNELLRDFSALPQLVRHDAYEYHVHVVPLDGPLAAHLAVEAAMAVADLLCLGELNRLRSCGVPECTRVLVDLSRNRSKRYCDVRCSNRAAVIAYRTRAASVRRAVT